MTWLWRLSIPVLILSVTLYMVYVSIGLPFLPALLQTKMHLEMIGRHPPEWRYPNHRGQSLEMYSLAELFRSGGEKDTPTTAEGFRANSYTGLFFVRTALGSLQSCPRTHRDVQRELFVPVEGEERTIRVLQYDWDRERFDEMEDRGLNPGVILYFHGGGYVTGVPDSYGPFLSRLSRRTGARAYAVDYRLAPENPLPANLDDAVAVYRWILSSLGVDASRVAVGGDSAGGGMVISFIQRILSDGDLAPPLAAFGLSPWVDISGEASALSYEENADIDLVVPPDYIRTLARIVMSSQPEGREMTHPLLSPLYGSFDNFPPLFVTVSQTETFRDEAFELVRRVRKAGGEAEVYMPNADLPHCWVVSCLPEGVEDSGVVAYWLSKKWGERKA